jgi:uncharacterized membrane protein YkoI
MKKLLLSIAACVSLAAPALADDGQDKVDQKAASEALARGEILPIVRVRGIATARVPGDVVKVKLEREPWGFKYEVKVLARNGRVREVEIDARTGRVIKIEDD